MFYVQTQTSEFKLCSDSNAFTIYRLLQSLKYFLDISHNLKMFSKCSVSRMTVCTGQEAVPLIYLTEIYLD